MKAASSTISRPSGQQAGGVGFDIGSALFFRSGIGTKQPKSTGARKVQQATKKASQAWSKLTHEEREAWKSTTTEGFNTEMSVKAAMEQKLATEARPRINGFNGFMSLNWLRSRALNGIIQLNPPPAGPPLPAPIITGVTATINAGANVTVTVNVTIPSDVPDGETYLGTWVSAGSHESSKPAKAPGTVVVAQGPTEASSGPTQQTNGTNQYAFAYKDGETVTVRSYYQRAGKKSLASIIQIPITVIP